MVCSSTALQFARLTRKDCARKAEIVEIPNPSPRNPQPAPRTTHHAPLTPSPLTLYPLPLTPYPLPLTLYSKLNIHPQFMPRLMQPHMPQTLIVQAHVFVKHTATHPRNVEAVVRNS